MKTYIIIAVIAYLLGSIPFGYILVRLFLKQDIRQSGSGNIGATNVARSGAKGLAIATLALDAGKGYLAVYFARILYLRLAVPQPTQSGTYYAPFDAGPWMLASALAAFFAIVGHCFPIWLKFKGGKGVATGVGAFAALAPKAVLLALLVFAVTLFISRFVSLASVIAAAIFPFAAYALHPELRSAVLLSVMIAASALIIVKHHQNIRRLLTGNEDRFGAKTA
jgi:glycerol-3-phosphate acyltransferase PlsY